MAITSPYLAQTVGIPGQETESFLNGDKQLLSGHNPAVATEDYEVAASKTIVALSPVGFDGSGRLIPAVSGTTQAIGIAIFDITTDASTDYKGLAVYVRGVFNPDAIVWPASYDTAAKKKNAFAGAPSPTDIIIRSTQQGASGAA